MQIFIDHNVVEVKGVKGAALKQDDVVDHFFVASTHDWLLFFTNQGRGLSRQRFMNYQMQVAMPADNMLQTLMAFKPDEQIAEVLSFKDYNAAPFLVIATQKAD
jgi:DNA gyrase subunit A